MQHNTTWPPTVTINAVMLVGDKAQSLFVIQA